MAARTKKISVFAVILLFCSEGLHTQDLGSQKIVFHVTAVRSEESRDYCASVDCRETKFTVEGYSEASRNPTLTEYILECVEILAYKPTPHLTARCVRVHARNSYAATVLRDAITFGEIKEGSFVFAYDIVSEKEVNRAKKQ